MLASTVSSRMLAHMAHVEGFHYKETLTGFKWLGNASRDLDAEGYNAAFAFEEANATSNATGRIGIGGLRTRQTWRRRLRQGP